MYGSGSTAGSEGGFLTNIFTAKVCIRSLSASLKLGRVSSCEEGGREVGGMKEGGRK